MSIKSFFMAIHKQFLSWGVLHESERAIEKFSVYVLFGSLILVAVFLFLGMVSRFLLGGLFEEFFMIVLRILYIGIWLGVALVVLSTNKII